VNAHASHLRQRTVSLLDSLTSAPALAPHFQQTVSSPVKTRVRAQHAAQAGKSARASTDSAPHAAHASG
jgi:hypothetical protein